MNPLVTATLIEKSDKIIKAVASILFLSAGGFVTYILIKNYYDRKKLETTSKDIGKEVNKNNLSYSEGQYKTFADIIFNSMQGYSEDEKAIADTILKMKTKDDWYKLVQVFGVRDVSPSLFLLPKKQVNLITGINEYVRDDKENWSKIEKHLNKLGVYL